MKKIIKGSILIPELHLTKLPDLSDVHIQWNFYCLFNNLTNLIGAPKSVGGDFTCINGNLTSLIGATQSVGMDFVCRGNKITSLKGAPQTVKMDFNCSHNRLTNLIGAPVTVGGGVFCDDNDLDSLEGIPKRIGYKGEDGKWGSLSLYEYDRGFHISANLRDKFPEEHIRSLSDIRGSIYYY